MSSSTLAASTSASESSSLTSDSLHLLARYKIYIVTWNVGSRLSGQISLRSLLGLQHTTTAVEQHLPDIYAVGLQEVNAQPQAQVIGLFKEDPWTHKFKKTLREFHYVLVKTEHMQGLLVSIFVRREHIPHLKDIEAEFTRTGFGGLWGNKGAVSVRFNLYGHGLTFVAAHLAAHDQHLDERVEDFNQILENHHYHVPRFREIHDHDYVFWFGDLNFRLSGEDSPAEVLEAIKEERFEALMERDQLHHVREYSQQAFQLLHERKPDFPPTFKFKEGTNEYDLKRRPAWCDRILFAVQPLKKQPNTPLEIVQISYKSHPSYNISDHKPVTSEFSIKLDPNHREICVEFREITNWPMGEDFMVEYVKPLDFEERKHDWIGLFPVDYSSLHEYIAYEYVNQAESPPTPPETPVADSHFETPHRHGRNKHCCHREKTEDSENIRLEFSGDIELTPCERYLLIYFQDSGIRGVSSVAGISNIFSAIKRRHSHSD